MEYLYETENKRMREIYHKIEKYAHSKLRVLFSGPPGSGKEALTAYYVDKLKETHGADVPYVTATCAGISGPMAESELYGVAKRAATEVGERPGLFERAINGVLFLDEIGDLSPEIQPKLLRAIDPGEACRVGGLESYKTSSVALIAATERSLGSIRQALLDRFHAKILVPSLDDRPEDLFLFIHFFFCRALVRRGRDLGRILKMLSVPGDHVALCKNPRMILNNRVIETFANEACTHLVPLALESRWPANIRGLCRAVSCAVIEAEDLASPERILKSVADVFRRQKNADRTVHDGDSALNTQGEVDKALFERIQMLLPGVDDSITGFLTRFFFEREERRFKLRDVQDMLREHGVIRGRRALQNWLGQLCDVQVLVAEGKGRNTRYRLLRKDSHDFDIGSRDAGFLSLPPDVVWPDGCRDDMDALRDHLQQTRVIYVSGNIGETKGHCIKALGKELSSERLVRYYEFGDLGLPCFLQVLEQEIQERGIGVASKAFIDNTIDTLSWVTDLADDVKKLFPEKTRPLLILNNVHVLMDSLQEKALHQMVRDWRTISFCLVGDKPRGSLNEFLEYPMSIRTYRPKPIDTSLIRLSDDLLELTEQLAANAHDRWALRRMHEGWRYGPTRNESAKKHPDLLPYDDIPDYEREYDRDMALETLKAILALGYRIEPIQPVMEQ